MSGRNYFHWAAGTRVMLVALGLLAASFDAKGEQLDAGSRWHEPRNVGSTCDNPCDCVRELAVECAGSHPKLRAFVRSSRSPGTHLTLVADGAFYRNVRTNSRHGSVAVWQNPVMGLHDVCIDECGICETVTCGCFADSDCDDGDACTEDACENGECSSSAIRCPEGRSCDPDTGDCVECLFDIGCDDGFWCNGEERCFAGDCLVGAEPCRPDQICHEDARVCEETDYPIIEWPDHPNGPHFYQYVQAPHPPPADYDQQWDWDFVEEAARQASHNDLPGYLATVTGAEEQQFIEEYVLSLQADNGLYPFWIGGQEPNDDGDWVWITGEPWAYTNWCPGEPNDGSGGEDWLMMSESTDTYGCWNDQTFAQPGRTRHFSYLIEYGSTGGPTSTYPLVATEYFDCDVVSRSNQGIFEHFFSVAPARSTRVHDAVFSYDGRLLYVAKAPPHAAIERYDAATGEYLGDEIPSSIFGGDGNVGLALGPVGSNKMYVTYNLAAPPYSPDGILEHDLMTGITTEIMTGLTTAWGLAVAPDGDIFVTEWETGMAKHFEKTFDAWMQVETITNIDQPEGLAVDPTNSRLYVVSRHSTVHEFDISVAPAQHVRDFDCGCDDPIDVAFDGHGDLYIACRSGTVYLVDQGPDSLACEVYATGASDVYCIAFGW